MMSAANDLGATEPSQTPTDLFGTPTYTSRLPSTPATSATWTTSISPAPGPGPTEPNQSAMILVLN